RRVGTGAGGGVAGSCLGGFVGWCAVRASAAVARWDTATVAGPGSTAADGAARAAGSGLGGPANGTPTAAGGRVGKLVDAATSAADLELAGAERAAAARAHPVRAGVRHARIAAHTLATTRAARVERRRLAAAVLTAAVRAGRGVAYRCRLAGAGLRV